MSCFICQAFSENSPSNPQLAQECPATPLSSLHSLHHLPYPPLALYFSSLSLHITFYLLPSSCPLFLSACSSFQGWQLGRGEHGETSRSVPKLTSCSLQTQRVAVEIGSRMAKLDLLLFYYFSLSVPASRSPQCCFFHSAPLL